MCQIIVQSASFSLSALFSLSAEAENVTSKTRFWVTRYLVELDYMYESCVLAMDAI